MSITVSPEIEAKTQQIPDFSARLERFIENQFELEQWRSRCAKSEIAAIVEEGLQQGAVLRASEQDRIALFARLQTLSERLPHDQ
ncbi:MAG: hypothetical protein ACKV2Q_29300 [Planctomycetaceae bacterium]